MTTRHKKQDISTSSHGEGQTRARPTVCMNSEGSIVIDNSDNACLRKLVGVKTDEAAHGVFCAALHALGGEGEVYLPLMTSIFAEMEPVDAAEAMLVTQMTATHVMMAGLSNKLMVASNQSIRASYEKSITRLSRTFLAQMVALKQYRSKAQQVVRVERVTVHEGGQAVVGDVTHGGKG